MKKNLPMATRNSDLRAQAQTTNKGANGTETIDELLRRLPDGSALILVGAGAVFITMLVLGALYLLTVGVMNLDVIMATAPKP